MQVATVHIRERIEPDMHHSRASGERVKGYITKQDATGVWLNSRDDGRGDSRFYPMHQVLRIDYDTGW